MVRSLATAALFGAIPSLLSPSVTALDRVLPTPSAHVTMRKAAGENDGPGEAGEGGRRETLATLVNTHSHEIVVLDDGSPSGEGFSSFLADRATGEATTFDPRLLGLLRSVARAHEGARIEIVSGYRSPKLNERLRKKGHHVASHSQHSLGHAVDFRVVGVTPGELHAELTALGWVGGIGQYDAPSDRFVHADVGRARTWAGR